MTHRIELALALAFMATSINAQTGGAITGTVKDSGGGVLPMAIAKFTNTATGVTTSTLTNQEGLYRTANLQPGHYRLEVSASGLATGVQPDVVLNVGAEITIDFTLNPATVSGQVDVKEEISGVDTVTSSLSYAVGGTTMRELPLNGRDFTSLAVLQPGVTSIGTLGGMRAGYGNKLSISGTRPSTNNFLFDGVSMNDSGNNTPGSILGVTLGVDAVEQFSVLTNTFSAEYGRAAGGVINAITRSGTNQVHGSGFYFSRNSALDARNYFDSPTQARPLFRRHQYGGTLGGPIVKDRTFWFFDYEGVRQYLGTTTLSTVPSAVLRNGTFVNPNGSITNYTVDPAVEKVLKFYPMPNAGLIGLGNTGFFSGVVNNIANEQYILAKIDHKISDADSIRGSYFFDSGTSRAPDAFLNEISDTVSRRQGASVEHTRVISPSLVNVARVGFSRTLLISGKVTDVLNPAISDKSLGFVPGLDVGGITVPGLTSLSAGPTALDYNFAAYTSYQAFDSLNIVRGTHALKVGVNFDRMQYNSSQPNLTGGSFSYGSLQGFITNGLQGTNPSITFAATLAGTNDERGMRQSLIGAYIQDDWRIRKDLTLNLGMRYEITTIPDEVQNKIALLHSLADTAPKLGGPIQDSNPTLRDFSPRIGAAWSPGGKTSLRAGFGIFDNLPLLYLFDTPLMRSFPYFTQGVLTNVSTPGLYGSFPDKAYGLITAGTLRTAYVDIAPPRSYTMQWNFNIQRQVGAWIAKLGYVGSRGVHLVQVERNLNVVYPTLTTAGWFYPSGSQKLNPNFATINTTDTWNADSNYHSLHASVSRPLLKGLQAQASYTFGKSLDDSSSTSSVTAGTGYPNAIGSPAPLIPSINRGLSDFDIRHNFIMNWVYELPGLKTKSPIHYITNGWEAASIFTARTGSPFTVVLSSDQAGTKADTTGGALGERPNLVNSPECQTLTNPGSVTNYIKTGCFTYPQAVTINGVKGNVLGNLARNTLTAPGLLNMDFSLIKNDRIH
ncbi:MAG TPA: TonB-dependent receptor, partial [Vicinamibacterales bacterium]|nr:TonB-dependent receptor [Vicinamibacterales bacterium]